MAFSATARCRAPPPPRLRKDGMTTALLRFEADVARDLAPQREIPADGFGELFWWLGVNFESERGHFFAHVGQFHRGVKFTIEQRDNLL